jgi:SAM-dependent methyltransferase
MEIGVKQSVSDFWQAASCGERLFLQGTEAKDYQRQAESRYDVEAYIPGFARFEEGRDRDVLEIGVGLGADHQLWAAAGARLTGIDLTPRAVGHSRRRLEKFGLSSDLRVADAEHLPFADNSFDIVYSWGVIHHTPDTEQAAREIMRVLRPGGRFAVMIYHKRSLVGYMLWLRYALLRGRPFTSLATIYARYLESPGTKAYTEQEGEALFRGASRVHSAVVLSGGDLLTGGAGQRHEGFLLSAARRLWPRALIRRFLPKRGLFLLIDGHKAV